LQRALSGHLVTTAFESGGAELANGDLLRQAEAKFDLLITTDQDLRYQQNLVGWRLAMYPYRSEESCSAIFSLAFQLVEVPQPLPLVAGWGSTVRPHG
jgi:hypothetical protein